MGRETWAVGPGPWDWAVRPGLWDWAVRPGLWDLGGGTWAVGPGPWDWAMRPGRWDLGRGTWVVGPGLWDLGSGAPGEMILLSELPEYLSRQQPMGGKAGLCPGPVCLPLPDFSVCVACAYGPSGGWRLLHIITPTPHSTVQGHTGAPGPAPGVGGGGEGPSPHPPPPRPRPPGGPRAAPRGGGAGGRVLRPRPGSPGTWQVHLSSPSCVCRWPSPGPRCAVPQLYPQHPGSQNRKPRLSASF